MAKHDEKAAAKIEQALTAKDLSKALRHTIAAWQKQRSPSLAALAQAISEHLVVAAPAPELDQARYLKAARDASAVELAVLLPQWRAKKLAESEARLLALAAHDDPRVGQLLNRIVRQLPFTSNSSKTLWNQVFRLVAELGDPQLLSLSDAPQSWNVRKNIQGWFEEELGLALSRLSETLGKQSPEPESLKAAVDKLAGLLPQQGPSAAEQDADELLANIYRNPGDTSARLVYADVLQELGDPRGEFIALQCHDKLGKADARRAKELLKKHVLEWLGPLEPVLPKSHVEFRRGFPASGRLTWKRQSVFDELGNHASWRTLEQLELYAIDYATNSEQHRTAQNLPPAAAPTLRRLSGVYDDALRGLAAIGALPQLEELTLKVERPETLSILNKLALPSLRQLTILNTPNAGPWEWTFPWMKQLRGLTIHLQRAESPTRAWYEFACGLPALEHFAFESSWSSHRFNRDGAGQLSRLFIDQPGFETPHLLEALPDMALTELHVARSRKARNTEDPKLPSQLQAFAERQKRLKLLDLFGDKTEYTPEVESWAGPRVGRPPLFRSENNVRPMIWTPAGICLIDAEGVVCVAPDSGEVIWRWVAPPEVCPNDIQSDGTRVYAGGARMFELDAKTGELLGEYPHGFNSTQFAVSARANRCLRFRPLALFDLDEFQVVNDFKRGFGYVSQPACGAFSHDGSWLALARQGELRLFKLEEPNQTPVYTLPPKLNGKPGDCQTLAWSPDDKVLSAVAWEEVDPGIFETRVLPHGVELIVIKGAMRYLTVLEDTFIASRGWGRSGRIFELRRSDAKQLWEHEADNFALSPDRKQLVVTGERLTLFDLATHEKLWEQS